MNTLPPYRHGASDPDEPERTGRARSGGHRIRTLRWFGLAALGTLAVGFGAGTLFGRVDPERAARLVVSEYTVTEDGPAGAAGPDPTFPVTGPDRGSPACGRSAQPLDPQRQVATVAAGVVIVQHRPEPTADEEAVLEQLAARDRVVVAPNGTLAGAGGPAVVATSWRQRMALDRLDADLLDAFVTGHADRAPALEDCP